MIRCLLILGVLAIVGAAVVPAVEASRPNPYQPLIVPSRAPTPHPTPVEPSAPQLPELPVIPVLPAPQHAPVALPLPVVAPVKAPSPSAGVRYVGVAFDAGGALAAVRANGRIYLVRVGDRVAGALVVAVTPTTLTLRQNGKTVTQRLTAQ